MNFFSCVLRSDSKPDNLDTWMLRFDFEDHSTCLHELTLETIRCTDYQLDLASINAILPGIECMPWLDELVHSAASLLRQSRPTGMPLHDRVNQQLIARWQPDAAAPGAAP